MSEPAAARTLRQEPHCNRRDIPSSRIRLFPMPSITETAAWKALESHQSEIAKAPMRDLFAADPGRFAKFSATFTGTPLDYSKNRIPDKTLSLLLDLAKTANLRQWIDRTFAGDRINITEDRA